MDYVIDRESYNELFNMIQQEYNSGHDQIAFYVYYMHRIYIELHDKNIVIANNLLDTISSDYAFVIGTIFNKGIKKEGDNKWYNTNNFWEIFGKKDVKAIFLKNLVLNFTKSLILENEFREGLKRYYTDGIIDDIVKITLLMK